MTERKLEMFRQNVGIVQNAEIVQNVGIAQRVRIFQHVRIVADVGIVQNVNKDRPNCTDLPTYEEQKIAPRTSRAFAGWTSTSKNA